jgi:hypothetical protein
METTEKIVESYVRHIRGWATIPNIRCVGQYEIDLLAIDPIKLRRYHIETSISSSAAFARLTTKTFNPDLLKQRVHQASMRRTLGYFLQHKFGRPQVKERLSEFGFKGTNHRKVVVTWSWTPEAKQEADKVGIELWDFQQIMRDIADGTRKKKSYFNDDTLRTIGLFVRAASALAIAPPKHAAPRSPRRRLGNSFWVYRNWTHRRARLHRAACSHCNNGRGTQIGAGTSTGEWRSFPTRASALAFLSQTGYDDCGSCRVCM